MDSVSLGDIAGMIAALAFAFLVFRLGSVIGKAGKILDETRVSLRNTTNVSAMTTNASALTSLFAATLGSPVVKVAAFTYGVRSALSASGTRSAGGRRRRRG